MTLLQKLDRLPPIICRMMAKSAGQLMSDPELMERTGFGKKKLRRIYNAVTWERIPVGDADKFLRACGLSWSSQRRELWLLRLANGDITKMRHLQTKTLWRISMIQRHAKRVARIAQKTTIELG